MSVILFGKSVLENAGATIGGSATATGFGAERLYDRDKAPLCKANASGQFDLDITLSSADSASAFALINHNQAAGVEIYADTASAIGTTLVTTLTPTGVDPFYGTFTLQNKTKFRLRFLTWGGVVQIGELLLGVPRTLTTNPRLRDTVQSTLGNVRRVTSPGGYGWASQKGPARTRLAYGWAMPAADLTTYRAAFGEVSEGAKNLLVKDVLDVYRWMNWTDETLEPAPLDRNLTDGVYYEIKSVFEDAL